MAARITHAADSAIRDDFETLRNSFFTWLLWMTALVVVGLAMEAPEIWYDTIGFFGPHKEHRAHEWVKPWAALGWLLIIVGVAGEGVTEALVSNADGLLQTFNNILLTETSREAGNARISALEAALAATRAKQEADEVTGIATSAKSLANDALEKAQAANLALSKAEKESAEAQKSALNALNLARSAESHLNDALQRAANAEREAARLKGVLADRELTDEQVKRVGNKLSVFPGQEYAITAYWQSPESLHIAQRVDAALTLAHWSFLQEGNKGMLLGGIVGIFVYIHPAADASTKRAASALVDALQTEGLQAALQLENPNNPKQNTIAMNVGAKR